MRRRKFLCLAMALMLVLSSVDMPVFASELPDDGTIVDVVEPAPEGDVDTTEPTKDEPQEGQEGTEGVVDQTQTGQDPSEEAQGEAAKEDEPTAEEPETEKEQLMVSTADVSGLSIWVNDTEYSVVADAETAIKSLATAGSDIVIRVSGEDATLTGDYDFSKCNKLTISPEGGAKLSFSGDVTWAKKANTSRTDIEQGAVEIAGAVTSDGFVYIGTNGPATVEVGTSESNKNWTQTVGKLALESGSLVINGNLNFATPSTSAKGATISLGANAILDVNGDYLYNSRNDSSVTAGTIMVSGNLTRGEGLGIGKLNFSDVTRFVFDGSSSQVISGKPVLGNVVVSNAQGLTITNGAYLNAASIVADGNTCTKVVINTPRDEGLKANNASIRLISIKSDVEINGDAIFFGANAIESNREVVVDGNAWVDFDPNKDYRGKITLNNSKFTTTGNLYVGEFGGTNGSGGGSLHMSSPDDLVVVGGDLTFNTNEDSEITGGRIELSGDFKALRGTVATGDSTIEFCGSEVQKVDVNGLKSKFAKVEINNDAGIEVTGNFLCAVSIASDNSSRLVKIKTKKYDNTNDATLVKIAGDFYNNTTITGDAMFINMNTVGANKELTVDGDLWIDLYSGNGSNRGGLELKEATLHVTGDLNNKSISGKDTGGGNIKMLNASDKIIVDGNITLDSYGGLTTLDAGEIYARGDIIEGARGGNRPSFGENLVVYIDGDYDKVQHITFENNVPNKTKIKTIVVPCVKDVNEKVIYTKDCYVTKIVEHAYSFKDIVENDAKTTVNTYLHCDNECSKETGRIYFDAGVVIPDEVTGPAFIDKFVTLDPTNGQISMKKLSYEKTGYTNRGWRFMNGATQVLQANSKLVIDYDLLPAKNAAAQVEVAWEANTYTVRFHINNGQDRVIKQVLTYDTEEHLLANTFAVKGKYFRSWNTLANGTGESYDNEALVVNLTPVMDDIVELYAIWGTTPVGQDQYRLLLEGNGGVTVDEIPQTTAIIPLDLTETYQLKADTFVRPGYTFNGWNTQADGKGKKYAAKAKVSKLSATPGTDVTLYAQWKPISYKISYKLGGGKQTKAPTKYNPSVSTELKIPTKKGHTFTGWSLSMATSGAAVTCELNNPTLGDAQSEIANNIEEGSYGNVVLTANWRENTYKVVYHVNDKAETALTTRPDYYYEYTYNYSDVVDLSKPVADIDGITIADPTFAKTGIEYFSSNEDAKASGSKKYYLTKAVSKLTEKDNDVVDLYAQWGAKYYFFDYDTDGGKVAKNTPVSYKYDTKKDVKIPNPTRVGYEFAGWTVTYTDILSDNEVPVDATPSDEIHASIKVTDAKKHTISVVKGSVGNLTLKANWTPINYRVLIYSNNGTKAGTKEAIFDSTDLVAYDTDAHADLTAKSDLLASRPGYTLVGWNTKTNGKGIAATLDGDNLLLPELAGIGTKNNSTVKLYGVWQVETYNITYDLADDSTDEAIQAKKFMSTFTTKQAISLPTPTRAGFTFKGWKIRGDESGQIIQDSEATPIKKLKKGVVNEDITVTAVWVENTYTIAISLNGGVDGSGQKVIKKTTVSYTEDVLVSDLIPEGAKRAGYTASGVSIKSKGSSMYDFTESVSRLSKKNKGTITLYVIWDQNLAQ